MWLPELSLWHYKARAYHPGLGRFMQPDPIGYDAGMNLYAYVGGDPVNWVDPSGMAVECHDVWVRVSVQVEGSLATEWTSSRVIRCVTTPEPVQRDPRDRAAEGRGGGGGDEPQSDEGADCVADPQSCITVVADRGKRNVIHSDHRGVPTDELLGRYNDPNTSAAEKRRLQESLKGLGVRNIRKRLPRGIPGLKRGIIGPLILTCLLAPVTCGLIDTDGNGVIDPDEVI